MLLSFIYSWKRYACHYTVALPLHKYFQSSNGGIREIIVHLHFRILIIDSDYNNGPAYWAYIYKLLYSAISLEYCGFCAVLSSNNALAPGHGPSLKLSRSS